MQDKAVYFVRTVNKAVAGGAETDSDVLAGEIPALAVNALEVLLNNVLIPMIDNMSPADWGVCEEEHKKEFLIHTKKFSQDIHEAIDTISGGTPLAKIDPQFEVETRTTSKQPTEACVAHCSSLVKAWGDTIDKNLREWNEAEEKKGEPSEEGPLSELEHWRSTQRILTGLSEQIKGPACSAVLNLLHLAKVSNNAEKDQINSLLSNWKKKESDLMEKLNEAKDNVKYLRTLEPYMEPLYSGKPTLIIESMRGLMHAIKMMFSIARHYDKGSRMTILFSKITSQMIASCMQAITKGHTPSELWDTKEFPVGELSKVLESCIKLNTEYKKEFNDIKQKLNANPKGKHYEFTDTVIFGKFDLFCRRVGKLKDLFETIEQFQVLGKHNLENMQSILTDFYTALNELKSTNLDRLLDYKKNDFDINFVSFNANVSQIESRLMQFISEKVSQVQIIEQSIRFLEKFKTILKRDNLKKELEQKSAVLFATYQQSFNKIEGQYDTNQETPPYVRNMPEHAGKIMWLIHLYDKVARPLREFDASVRQNKEHKKCVESAWRFLKKVGLHKLLIHEKWEKRVESSKAALQSTLLTGGGDKQWQVNFETEIMTLIREAKCMSRMGMKLNENAKIILLQEEKFKTYYNELDYLIKEYQRISDRIRSNTREILKPHLEDLETRLRPGSITLTWTSMNIDGYLQHVHEGLRKLEQFIIKINDIMDNRIENNLKDVSKTELVDLSVGGKAFALDEFVDRQESCIREKSKGLKAKNMEVEQAVSDLRKAILAYERDPHVGQVANEDMKKIIKYYYWSMYQALLHATKHSLNALKERVCERKKDSKEPMLKPFFEVKVQLDGTNCVLNPPLSDIQNSINRAANAVLKSTKNVTKWIKGTNQTFYEWVAKDKEIVKVILLLTGSIEGTKNKVEEFLRQFNEFKWLWEQDIVKTQQEVSQKATSNEDYEKELKKLVDTENKIKKIPRSSQIGAMELKTDKIKETMLKILGNWKKEYWNDLEKKVKNSVDGLKDEIKRLTVRARRTVKDLATLGEVMQTLDDIRIKESEIKIQLKPVSEIYNLLEVYLKGVQDKEEENQKKVLENDWAKLVKEAEQRRTELQMNQTKSKRDLITSIKSLMEDAKEFCKEFKEKGPNVSGILPNEALDRLKSFKSKYDEVLKRKRENCERGEKIFNLTHKKYEELDHTDKEMTWLLSLYQLYATVLNDTQQWKEYIWAEVPRKYETMTQKIKEYDKKCQNLDEQLKKIPAYFELKDLVDNFNSTLPLIDMMSKPYILPRHWEKDLAAKIKKPISFTKETFTLGNFMDMNLIQYSEEIKEIRKAAEEQQQIEDKLREIDNFWNTEEFVLATTARKKDVPSALDIKRVEEIINKLEEHQTLINTMTAWRSSTPHQEKLQTASNKYSEVYDQINKSVKVQKIWQFLEPVFHTADIAKKMIQESKKFSQIEKDWAKVIEKLNEEKNVIRCCENDMVQQLLKSLEQGLDFCQKKLDTYLETKRREFPRFYFVSDTEVLNILSQGSDPAMVQNHLPSLFDGITNIEFDTPEKKFISKILCVYSEASKEELKLCNPVRVEQKIEEWLLTLEYEMKKTMRKTIEEAIKESEPTAKQAAEKDIPSLISKYPTQICQIILKSVWTRQVEEGRAETPSKRQSKDLIQTQMGNISTTLKDMIKEPSEDPNDILRKTKLEGLITIQHYQVEVYNKIITGEFEMEKQKTVRMEWKAETKDLEVKVTDFGFNYFYEFLKATEKLVITPLTDKCYISMAQALRLQCGGCALGPSGVGKTETIKDMGRTLGLLVIVTNCSEQHKSAALARLLKGVVATGVWGCLDEFSRIDVDVLSVIAGNLQEIASVKRQGLQKFVYPGDGPDLGETKHVESSAYFITVRCGIKGNVDLPENIKVQFRLLAMMQPDYKIIIEVKLTTMGFDTPPKQAEKFALLYTLCNAQLSKQQHYDFGLRNIIPVFSAISNMRRSDPDFKPDDRTLARAIREVNVPKLVGNDTAIFIGLLKDIFAESCEAEVTKNYGGLEQIVDSQIQRFKLNEGKAWKSKIFQLYNILQVRHGIIVVGPTGSGKSSMIQILSESMQIHKSSSYKITKINPKAMRSEDFYGAKGANSKEWIDGVFTRIWEKSNKKNPKQNFWIILDGPLDTSWVENLNSVLDDNKVLTLANAQRIPMTENVKLIFEIEQMNHVEPSTIGRCGILYLSIEDMGWITLFKSYLKSRSELRIMCNPNEIEIVSDCVKNYIEEPNIMEEIDKNYAPSLQTNKAVKAISFITIFNALLKQHTSLDKSGYEQLFIFSMCWGLGGLLEMDKRDHFQKFLLERAATVKNMLPQKVVHDKDSLFDYYLEKEGNGVTWKSFSVPRIDIPPQFSFSELYIPTLDTVRAEYLIDQVLPVINAQESVQKSVMLVGGTGTAKSATVLLYANNKKDKLFKMFTFSALTTPQILQDGIESQLHRKRARNYEPEGDKVMLMFMDDMSMPMPNQWGYQPTLELIRQFIDQSGMYFLNPEQRGDFMQIARVQCIGAMADPGAGWRDIPNRLKRYYFSFTMVMPSQQGLEAVFGMLMKSQFSESNYETATVKTACSLVEATSTLRNKVTKNLLPSPQKFHYHFSMREIAKVFQGILEVTSNPTAKVIQTSKEGINSNQFLILLWRHECMRSFHDKLISHEDRQTFLETLDSVTVEKFKEILPEDEAVWKQEWLFCNFLRKSKKNPAGEIVELAPLIYEAADSNDSLQKLCAEKLEEYNSLQQKKVMDLVLFEEAVKNLLKISRILQLQRGSALLIGIGGSGKQSLARLAAYIQRQELGVIKTDTDENFLNSIKELCDILGAPERKQTTLIISEGDIKQDSIYEHLNSFLATGEITDLKRSPIEKDRLVGNIKELYLKEAPTKEDISSRAIYQWLVGRIRDALHIVLAVSPASYKFTEKHRLFPAIFSTCQYVWFLPWSEDALVNVARGLITSYNVDCPPEVTEKLAKHLGHTHISIQEVCENYLQRLKRRVYITPRTFLMFIHCFGQEYTRRRTSQQENEVKIKLGIEKMDEAAVGLEKIKQDISKETAKFTDLKDKVDKKMTELGECQSVTTKENEKVEKKLDEVKKQDEKIAKEQEKIDFELQKANPFIQDATKAVNAMTPAVLGEIKALQKGNELTRLVVDCLLILFQRSLGNISVYDYEGKAKGEKMQFIKDSYEEQGRSFFTSTANFQKKLQDFIANERDSINDETCELLEPYLNFPKLNEEQILKTSPLLGNLLIFVRGIYNYHNASKHMKGRLADIAKLRETQKIEKAGLEDIQKNLKEETAKLETFKKEFTAKNEEKEAVNTQLKNLTSRFNNLSKLINDLQEDKTKWIEAAAKFKDEKVKQIDDACYAQAFVNYCGPFNHEYRQKIMQEILKVDPGKKDAQGQFDIVSFLVEEATLGEWQIEGLLTDETSIHNAILMTMAPRFPLIIDPQSQALHWIKKKTRNVEGRFCEMRKINDEANNLAKVMESGETFIIENMDAFLPPILEQVLDSPCGKFKKRAVKIMFKEAEVAVDEKFMLFMTTRLANPHFSPELSSKTSIIDFTMSNQAIEMHLLSKIITKEQRSFEEQLALQLNNVNVYKKTLQEIGVKILAAISSAQGSLIDNDLCVEELNKQKKKATETLANQKVADEKKRDLMKKRDNYKSVAKRGTALYLSLMDMSNLNWVYNTSLQQFLTIFDKSLATAKKASTIKDRSENISNLLTEQVFRYMNRALFTKDKALFALSMALHIKLVEDAIKPNDIAFFLKVGSISEEKQKSTISILEDSVYMNLNALSKHQFGCEKTMFFKDIMDKIRANEDPWKAWKCHPEPETQTIPEYNDKLAGEKDLGPFMTLCLIRCIREDRTIMAVQKFIADPSVLGPKYDNPAPDSLEDVYADSSNCVPVLYLLSNSGDPSTQIEELCKKKLKKPLAKIVLGEGQEDVKLQIETAMMPASVNAVTWVLVQNCHFGLNYMNMILEMLSGKAYAVKEEFRLFLTTEPTNKFPLGMLHYAIKVTNDPPKGLKDGMLRTLNQVVNQDRLEKLDGDKWKSVVFTMCFMHNVLLERRKYGPIGFCHPYEFSNADLDSCLTYLEKLSPTGNFEDSKWKMAKFMVCEIQYGGKITDERDRDLVNAYGEDFFKAEILKGENEGLIPKTKYVVPKMEAADIKKYKDEVLSWPAIEKPEIFGLANIADKAYRYRESKDLLACLMELQPRDIVTGVKKTRDEEVKEKLEKDIKPKLPQGFKDSDNKEKKGKQSPMHVFLNQEIRRYQVVYNMLIKAIQEIIMAIEGQLIMTEEIDEAIEALYRGKIPNSWMYDSIGAEYSWLSSSSASWFKELLQRYNQLNTWLKTDKLGSYWLGGFFNPQGFLFAVKQEDFKKKKEGGKDKDKENATLESFDINSEPQGTQQWTDVDKYDYKVTQKKGGDKSKDDLEVLIHGLYIEGAEWGQNKLEDIKKDSILSQFPIVKISVSKKSEEAQKTSSTTKAYYCPVYRYPSRGDRNLIIRFKIEPKSEQSVGTREADYWKKKGVALLCSKEYLN